MKVLFLDFDGVLNSQKFIRSCNECGAVIDPSKMVLLKTLIFKIIFIKTIAKIQKLLYYY